VRRREPELLKDEVDLGPVTFAQRSGDLRDDVTRSPGCTPSFYRSASASTGEADPRAMARELARTRP
jgi:hypothetical protein